MRARTVVTEYDDNDAVIDYFRTSIAAERIISSYTTAGWNIRTNTNVDTVLMHNSATQHIVEITRI